MPTVLRVGPYAFMFFASDRTEPPHVHVKRDRAHAKFWLLPQVRAAFVRGYVKHEVNELRKLVAANRAFFLERWDETFNPG